MTKSPLQRLQPRADSGCPDPQLPVSPQTVACGGKARDARRVPCSELDAPKLQPGVSVLRVKGYLD